MLKRLTAQALLIACLALLASCGSSPTNQLPNNDSAQPDITISNTAQPGSSNQSSGGEDSLTRPEQPTQKTGKQ